MHIVVHSVTHTGHVHFRTHVRVVVVEVDAKGFEGEVGIEEMNDLPKMSIVHIRARPDPR